jgi:DNA-binding PadR family transcriptional regulator
MPLTDFFIDYFPMYAKFRTVASILVIAEFTIPLLGMLALKEYFERGERREERGEKTNKIDKCFYISFIFTAGVCVLFAVMPGVFFDRFVSANEMQALNQLPAEYVTPILQNLTEMRKAVFTADCWRSFWIVVIGAALMMLHRYKKLRGSYAIAAIIVLCLADMWIVNKRYLNNDMFVPKSEREMPQQKTKTDEFILQDTSDEGDYRVLNLAGNTFNENNTSYYHKSIGGYHAAKLRRYQELIDAYISPEMRGMMSAIAEAGGDMTKVSGDSIYPVLNMLNTKYIIVPLQGGETVPIQNPYTYGNAWLVDNITYVDNANEELDGLKGRDLRHSAVADKRFKDILGESTPQGDVSVVSIKSYEPDHLTYEVESDKGGVVVFSEIYYPGWTATVDGESVEVGRVNYVLRAIRVAPGRHNVELSFYPKSIVVTETIAYITSAILIVAMLVLIALRVVRRKS